MSDHPLDHPDILFNLFHVRKTVPIAHPDNKIKDGIVHIDDEVELGYRLYVHHSNAPILLYFHGNGEIAIDYEPIAPFYHTASASLLVVDYRGYGWSTGTPLTSTLLPDAQAVLDHMPSIEREQGIVPDRPLFVMGRSLGSAPAIYLAMNNADRLRGLIIESGYADAPSLFRRLGIVIPDNLRNDDSLPLGNDEKIMRVTIPTLIIHGERDMLIPIKHGQTLYEKASSADKTLVTIPNAGHNDVSFVDVARYFSAIRRFLQAHT
ncbi:MAG: alpha/beta hydrolase [Anaerolineae bacterium]